MASGERKIAALILLAAGVAGWLCLTSTGDTPIPHPALLTPVQIVAMVIAAALALVPGVSRSFVNALDRWIRRPTPRARALAAWAIFLACTTYIILTAFRQDRELYPRFHDDQMHLISMRLLACFRLWTASHPMAEFFDTFHTIVRPVYASAYFPGTAVMYVWELWLHTPLWLGPALVAGAVVAFMYRVVAELLDDAVLGWLAAFLVLGVREFRYLSMVIMSHTVLMVLGLATIWAYLRWRQHKSLWWAAAVGLFAGWAAITRPLDALCYAAPVGVAMGWTLLTTAPKTLLKTAAIVIAAAAPFLSMQLTFNKGVTGHWLKTPYQFYHEQYAPNLAYGRSTYDPNLKSATLVRQKQIYDQVWNARALEVQAQTSPWMSWYRWKFRQLLSFGLPAGVLIILMPLGLMALFDPARRDVWLLWGMLPFYLVGYAFFAFLLPHYCAVPSPGLAFTIVMGVAVLRSAFPGPASAGIETACVLGIVVASVMCLSEFTPRTAEYPYGTPDDYHATPTMRAVALDLPKAVQPPAVVLFRFNDGDDYNQEPVYNYTTCNPDDAAVIRAQDLGLDKDREIFDYYARTQPDRRFYLFDRHDFTITPLGTAQELATRYPLSAQSAQTAPTQPTSQPASAR